MIKLDLLDALSDSELDQIEAYSQALKQRRDEARAILAAAGISLEELNGKKKGRPAKGGKKSGRKASEAA